jgi:hypothetical protein
MASRYGCWLLSDWLALGGVNNLAVLTLTVAADVVSLEKGLFFTWLILFGTILLFVKSIE